MCVGKDISGYPLYGVVTENRAVGIGEGDFHSYHFRKIRYTMWKKGVNRRVKATIRSWASSA